MPSGELKHISVNHGVTAYNREAIARTRARCQSNKAHIRTAKEKSTKRFITKAVFYGLTFLAVVGLYADYVTTKSAVGEEISDTYISQLGTIIDRYSKEELLALANQTLEITEASNKEKDQAAAADIRGRLARIEELTAKDMMQEVGWQWQSIVATASGYDVFLPGYSFDRRSIGGKIIDEVTGLFK